MGDDIDDSAKLFEVNGLQGNFSYFDVILP